MRLKIYSALLFLTLLSLLNFNLNAQQLQPKTFVQIQALLNEKRSRTVTEQKISSLLLQTIKEKNNQPMAQGVQLEKANVNIDNLNNLEVDIYGDITDDLITKIQNLGGKVIYPSAEYHTLRAFLNINAVKTIAGFNEVKFIKPAAKFKLVDVNNNLIKKKQADKDEIRLRKQLIGFLQNHKYANLNTAADSPVTSEGDRTHRADDARNTFGYSGEGVKIGVISDSYNATSGAAQDILNGDLPGTNNPLGDTTPVTVVFDDPSGDDEGRAMLHIVHDLAPKARLFFATADYGEANFASQIKKLRFTYHCDIIIDDVEYDDEPPFEDGIVAQAVNTVTADGAMYFSSAGNQGSVAKNTFSVYEGDFNDKGSPADTLDSKHGSIHNFGTQAVPITGDGVLNVGDSGAYWLEWADPLGKSANDYDLFLVDKKGAVIASSTDVQNGIQDPIEVINAFVYSGDKLVVFKDSAAAKRAIRLNAGFATNGGVQGLSIGTNGQTFGHSAAVNAFSVAATPAQNPFSDKTVEGPYPKAFDTTNQVEIFSSDGPRRIFYNADTTPVTVGNFLFSTGGGLIRNKPDVTAADGVLTHTTNSDFDPFYGTSAAAPHAGAIAALLKSANPDLTAAQIRNLLTSTTLDIEAKGYDNNSGYGIIQAYQAMQKLNPKPHANILSDTAYAKEASPSNNNGFVEPGETASFFIKLRNDAALSATKVSAVISTTTPGVTILNDSSYYGTIDSGEAVLNTAKPFSFKTNTTTNCGYVVQFKVIVTYAGGYAANKTFEYFITIGRQPFLNITAHLGSPKSGEGYTISTGQQTGRLKRAADVGSTCDSLIPNPGVYTAAGAGLRTYDAYTFTNTSSNAQCITVTLNANHNDSIYTTAYNDSGFVPALPANHFLAEPVNINGFSYGFNINSGKSFTVVVYALYASSFVGAPYTLGVSLAQCPQIVLAVSEFNLSAEADQANLQIPLQWAIANDQQTRLYEVQRSTDGIHFNTLQSLPSALSSSQKIYSYIDKAPAYGDNYYRIKSVDVNGAISYSNTAKAALQHSSDITLMPNPASAYINVISKNNMSKVQVFDPKGRLLQTLKPQSNFCKLETGRFAAGQYFIRIQTGNGIVTEKFIKQ